MTVLLVDDHAIVRAGLCRLLGAGGRRVLEAANGRDALTLACEHRPELIVLDLNLPGIGGLELLRRLLQDNPHARILVLSMHAEPIYAGRAIEAGARGYVSKNAQPDELLLAVQRIADGGRYVEAEIAQQLVLRGRSDHRLNQLTERDMEILRQLADGRSLGEIADAIGVSYKTVANACSQVKAKLGVARTVDLVRLAIEMRVTA